MNEAPSNNRRTIIIVVVIAAILLCCCCVGMGAVLWTYGDQIVDSLDLSRALPLTLATL